MTSPSSTSHASNTFTRAADVIASRLHEAGVRHAFGIPGGEILILIDALEQAGIGFVTTRQETAAGLMADGTVAHTGAPGVLAVTVGPGLSSAVNAVANAFLDRVPLIVLSGAVDPRLGTSYTHQVFDQRALLGPITKASFVAESGSIDLTIRRALALSLQAPRGPVHIDLPVNVAGMAEPFTDAAVPASQETSYAALLTQMASELAAAQRPLILAGLEAVSSGSAHELAQLMAATGTPVLTTYKAKGVVDEHAPLALGAIGLSPRADALVAPLLRQADVVLLVGYDPVEMRASYRQPFGEHTRVLELAACPREHTMHEASLTAIGTIETLLRALRAELPPSAAPATRWPNAEPTRMQSALQQAFAAGSGFSPQAVCEVLSRVVPDTTTITVDTGAHRILLSQVLRKRTPQRLLQSSGLCTMGYALPAAMGLSLASGQRVVAVAGDGGFDMSMHELATLRDLGLPITLVIFDDRSLALIDVKQRAEGLPRHGVWLGGGDHVALASAFGGRAEQVRCAEHFEAALRRALAEPTGFDLISCALERGAYEGLL